jgi:excisionase family DNA binding protein
LKTAETHAGERPFVGKFPVVNDGPIEWIGTPEACARLGVTLRTLYRFIDEGQLPAYKMGRVIRLQAHEVDAFIERARIAPGTLEHLYPDPRGSHSEEQSHSEDQSHSEEQSHSEDRQ